MTKHHADIDFDSNATSLHEAIGVSPERLRELADTMGEATRDLMLKSDVDFIRWSDILERTLQSLGQVTDAELIYIGQMIELKRAEMRKLRRIVGQGDQPRN